MAIKVNLLPKRSAREIIKSRWLKRLKKGTLITVAIYGLVLLVVFGVRLFLKTRRDDLTAQVNEAKKVVLSYEGVETKHALVKGKLSKAVTILKARNNWSLLLSDLLTFLPSDEAISSITLDQQGLLTLVVETSRLQELALVLNALFQVGLEREFVEDVYLISVEKSSAGIYSFSLVFIPSKTIAN